MVSRYLTSRQMAGLRKTGDALLPGSERLPAWSQTGCLQAIDDMAAYLSPDDLSGLQMVLGLFAWLPRWTIRLIMSSCHLSSYAPGPLGKALRMLEIGVKGAVMTPYYANRRAPDAQAPEVHVVMGWDARVNAPAEPETDADADGDGAAAEPRLHEPAPADIAAIFERSRRARQDLGHWTVAQRLEFIGRLRETIIARQDRILDHIQKETAKSRTDALTSEIFGTLDHLDYLEKTARRMLADRKVPTPLALMGKRSSIRFEPLGTVLIISPWNYPFYQAIVPITSAFVLGNAVVYKPSELTPLEGLVESLLAEAGFDPAWVQVVYGEGSTGAELIAQRPDKIFFIGSQATGRTIMRQAAEQLIPVELEMGGKDPMLVFEDADIQRAAAGAVWGAFTNSGQSCTAVEKLFVHATIYEPFKARLLELTRALRVGTDRDGEADIGPMTTARQVAVVAGQVADAREKGATFLTGADWDLSSDRIPPMVVEGSTEQMRLNREESFGPILPIFPFSSEAEVIARANDSTYGLSASVWTADPDRVRRITAALVTGNVSVSNVMLTEGNHALPFGGTRQSGIGRYKGEFGYYCFANVKSVLVDRNSGKWEANWFPYSRRKLALFSKLTAGLYASSRLTRLKSLIYGLQLEAHTRLLKRRSHSTPRGKTGGRKKSGP